MGAVGGLPLEDTIDEGEDVVTSAHTFSILMAECAIARCFMTSLKLISRASGLTICKKIREQDATNECRDCPKYLHEKLISANQKITCPSKNYVLIIVAQFSAGVFFFLLLISPIPNCIKQLSLIADSL